jgi:hypothetical protein
MKISPHQTQLLRECCKYKISSFAQRYLRLGGSGEVPMRYNANTLRILSGHGLVEYVGYWQATEAGKAFIAALK